MIIVFIFLAVSLTTAVAGCALIWGYDAIRAEEVRATSSSAPGHRALPPAAKLP